MARRKKTKTIAINNVDSALWEQVAEFLNLHKRIPSNSQLGLVALETYLALANRYGIDGDWHIKIPGIPETVYKGLQEQYHPSSEASDAPKDEGQ